MNYKHLILSLYLLASAWAVQAQKWQQFDNEWVPVELDDNVSLQLPAKPLKDFATDEPGFKAIGTKKKLTYYYAKSIDQRNVSGNIPYLYDSLVNKAHLAKETAMDTVRQNIYRAYIQQLSVMHHATINHVKMGADGVPGYWLEFPQQILSVYANTRQCIFYCNNRLYVLEFYSTLGAGYKLINDIWLKYINSVQVKNKN
jgi:hypothetical protein